MEIFYKYKWIVAKIISLLSQKYPTIYNINDTFTWYKISNKALKSNKTVVLLIKDQVKSGPSLTLYITEKKKDIPNELDWPNIKA